MVKEEHKYLFIAIHSQNKHLLSFYCVLTREEHDLTPLETNILKKNL